MRLKDAVRATFFWTHLAIGLSAGLLILLMSVTGALLGFERQMIAWIDGAPRVASAAAPRLTLDSLLAHNALDRRDIASVVIRRDGTQPVTLRLRERGAAALQLDPIRGTVLAATGAGKGQAFFSALRRWHRWVGAQGQELRARMKTVNGVANLLFLALVVSGFYLWWPRQWTVARLRATTLPQWNRAGKARDFNWHNSLGFWAAIPLALIIASGAFISFRWPGQWLDVALGSETERAAALQAMRAPTPVVATVARETRASRAASDTMQQVVEQLPEAPLASYVATATRARPAWAQLTVTMPEQTADDVRIAVAEGNTYRPDLRYTLTVERATGVLRESSGYDELSTARKIRAWVRFGHTGEVFGIPGQIIATLASAIGALLVWTGFALTWRRFCAWRARRSRLVPAVVALPDAALEPPTPLG